MQRSQGPRLYKTVDPEGLSAFGLASVSVSLTPKSVSAISELFVPSIPPALVVDIVYQSEDYTLQFAGWFAATDSLARSVS